MSENYYESIINMPHHQSLTRHHMSMHDRASQFAPFAALKGYEEAVAETARITDKKLILDDELIRYLNETINEIERIITTHPEIEIEYFVKDKYKDGGKYITKIGNIKKIDKINKLLIFDDQSEIAVDDIIDIKQKGLS